MVLMFTKQNQTKEGKQNKKKHLHTSKSVSLPSEEISVTSERTWGEVTFWEAFFRESPFGLSVIVVKNL